MSKTKRLIPIQKYGKHLEQEAAQRLQLLSKRVKQQQEKVTQLQLYSDEYRSNFSSIGAGGMDMSLVQNYRNFQSQLDALLHTQQSQLNLLLEEYRQHLALWTKQYRKVRMYEQLAEKYSLIDLKRQQLIEQKASDDRINASHDTNE